MIFASPVIDHGPCRNSVFIRHAQMSPRMGKMLHALLCVLAMMFLLLATDMAAVAAKTSHDSHHKQRKVVPHKVSTGGTA